MQFLTEDEVRERLDPATLIRELEFAFRNRYANVVLPERTQLPFQNGILLIMPCLDRSGLTLGMKLVSVLSKPAEAGDRVQATVILIDPESTKPILAMEGRHITAMRTAATSAIATKFMAREDVKTLGIFGTGRQAQSHLVAMPLARNFTRVLICGSSDSNSKTFCEQMGTQVSVPVEPCDSDRCAAESDVICTCTNSQSPLFDGKLLRPGTHLNLVGTFQPKAREVDSTTITRGFLVVDTYEGAMAEAGDILIPLAEGVIERDHIKADLHELVSRPRGAHSAELSVFKSVGCALEDLVAAELVARNISVS